MHVALLCVKGLPGILSGQALCARPLSSKAACAVATMQLQSVWNTLYANVWLRWRSPHHWTTAVHEAARRCDHVACTLVNPVVTPIHPTAILHPWDCIAWTFRHCLSFEHVGNMHTCESGSGFFPVNFQSILGKGSVVSRAVTRGTRAQ
jgi:hypothetical protein